MGLDATFTKQAAERIRPEGPGKPGADHPGYGTLFYTKKAIPPDTLFKKAPAAPAGITFFAKNRTVHLSWVAPYGAKSYTVKRATISGGPYATVATDLPNPEFTDTKVHRATIYYYTVTAANDSGKSA